MEWQAVARDAGLDGRALNEAISYLISKGLIEFTPASTQIIAVRPDGVAEADRMIKNRPELSDPVPDDLESIRFELDYWHVRQNEGQPQSDDWIRVGNRIDALRHKEIRLAGNVNVSNTAIGANARINYESTDASSNEFSGK